MAKGKKTGGRKKGTPNKASADVRAAIALIAERNVEAFETWLAKIKDPARRCEVFLRVLEYHVPKLSRSDVTSGGEPLPAGVVLNVHGIRP
ncbi:MAG: hypothetical protein EPO20_15095 [Betaproteobacteria bacterium]|nr:MAG: hypothetical protein EPO20_15095 [Betaproteobacteria bacterium]